MPSRKSGFSRTSKVSKGVSHALRIWTTVFENSHLHAVRYCTHTRNGGLQPCTCRPSAARPRDGGGNRRPRALATEHRVRVAAWAAASSGVREEAEAAKAKAEVTVEAEARPRLR